MLYYSAYLPLEEIENDLAINSLSGDDFATLLYNQEGADSYDFSFLVSVSSKNLLEYIKGNDDYSSTYLADSFFYNLIDQDRMGENNR